VPAKPSLKERCPFKALESRNGSAAHAAELVPRGALLALLLEASTNQLALELGELIDE